MDTTNKNKIIDLLRSTKRSGIEEVISWLDTEPNFFITPGAKFHHDNVEGGLAYHSLKVCELALSDWEKQDSAFQAQYPKESVIILTLLHDVCKKDVYFIDSEGVPQRREEIYRKGHGLRSVLLLEALGFQLTSDERMAIWWHMGKDHEMSQKDYPKEYAIAMSDPFCQLIHNADYKAARISNKEHRKEEREKLSWDAPRALLKIEKGGRFAMGAIRSEVYKHNIQLFQAWKYEAPSGQVINLIGDKQQLLDSTIVYREEISADQVTTRFESTRTGCVNQDCLIVAKQLIDEGSNPAVLNLADAHHACGLYNSGSGAQEESLCRASTLSLTLYQYFNKTWAEKAGVSLRSQSAYPMDIHFGGIYSPRVTVFRDNSSTGFALREAPFVTSIISVAALNFKTGHKTNNLEYCSQDGGFTSEGEQIMRDKIRTIYRIALLNGHDSIVLGAFGCGVFNLKPELVSELFHQTLEEEEFRNKFHTIVFALLEGKATSRKSVESEGKFAPFYNTFGKY